ncbi:MAG: FAD-dependent oxidoreductase [Thermoanaerobaculia bacterium]
MAGQVELSGPDLRSDGALATELEEGGMLAGHADGKPVVLARLDGEVHAVGGKCTHYGGPLGDGLCEAGRLHCPWHHARFDIRTGEAVGAPALNPLPVYRVEERGGRLFVEGPVETAVPHRQPRRAPESVVIVGAGAAGATAAETLRRLGYAGPITLFGSEAPVDRPNLSKDYLAGTAPEEWLPLRPESYYAEHGIDLRLGRPVTAIDRTAREVVLADGERLEYGALLLATGAEPVELAVPGADRPWVHTLRTLADSRALRAAAEAAGDAVVIGVGFIGLEVAASLRQHDVAVTVVAPEALPLERVIGRHLGRFVQSIHEEHGVRFRLGHTVQSIGEQAVVLDDGSELRADLVVVGIGVRPRVSLAEAAGLEVADGIVVDEQLRTSDAHIWAAGDAARYSWAGESLRIEHWVVAQRQGQCAAANILGAGQPFDDTPFFWSQHYDVPIAYVGHAPRFEDEVVRGSAERPDVLVGYRAGGRVRAVASIFRDVESLKAELALERGDDAAVEELFT